jgi:hypothetical protein
MTSMSENGYIELNRPKALRMGGEIRLAIQLIKTLLERSE